MDECIWVGRSGARYAYKVFPPGTEWYDLPGNYVFARLLADGRWQAIYVGQTDSFKNRLPCHEKLPCARLHGFTHIHAHVNQFQFARMNEETDLVRGHNPPCNVK
jgi:hypothetical protein